MKIQLHHHFEDSARAQQLERALKTQGFDTECKPNPPSISGSDQQTLLCFSLSLWHDPDWAEARYQEYAAHIYLDDTPLNPQQHSAEHYFDLHDWQPGLENSEFERLVVYLQKQQSDKFAETTVAKGSLLRRLTAIGVSVLTGIGIFYTLVSGQSAVSATLCEVPGVTGICTSRGWGGHATPEQQMTYENAIAGGCDGIRQYIQEEGHPETLVAKAQRTLQGAELIQVDHWEDASKSHPFYQSAGISNHPSEMAAREYTQNNAQHQAEQSCQGYLVSDRDQLIATTINIEEWQCTPHAKDTWDCSAKGTAQCQLRLYQPVSTEQCTVPDNMTES